MYWNIARHPGDVTENGIAAFDDVLNHLHTDTGENMRPITFGGKVKCEHTWVLDSVIVVNKN